MRTSYPPFTSRSILPSTASRAWNASSSLLLVAAPRASLRDSVSPPSVDITTAWMRSPTATSSVPSSFFSSAMSIIASPLPPTLTNATFAPMATMAPSTVWPFPTCVVFTEASNIEAKSSSGSVMSSVIIRARAQPKRSDEHEANSSIPCCPYLAPTMR